MKAKLKKAALAEGGTYALVLWIWRDREATKEVHLYDKDLMLVVNRMADCNAVINTYSKDSEERSL